jgi:hypothetical protein
VGGCRRTCSVVTREREGTENQSKFHGRHGAHRLPGLSDRSATKQQQPPPIDGTAYSILLAVNKIKKWKEGHLPRQTRCRAQIAATNGSERPVRGW